MKFLGAGKEKYDKKANNSEEKRRKKYIIKQPTKETPNPK